MSRKFALMLVLVAGCGSSNSTFHPADLSMTGGSGDGGGQGGGGGDDMAMSAVKCTTGYTETTIAAMRSAARSGCFSVGTMANVVAIAQQSSSAHGTMILQDEVATAADFSALNASCDPRMSAQTAGYACTVFSSFKSATIGNRIKVGGFYVHTSAGLEFFNIIDQFTDTGAAGTKPPALALTVADVKRTATTLTAAKLYQYANVTLGTGESPLKAYEWAPAALMPTGTSTCNNFPNTFGFGLIASNSADAGSPGPACTGMGVPMPAPTPSADEILISTSYYSGFKYTSDCKCNQSGIVLAATDTFTKLQGIVEYASGTIPTIAPLTNADIGK
jgi:hypothetical protein